MAQKVCSESEADDASEAVEVIAAAAVTAQFITHTEVVVSAISTIQFTSYQINSLRNIIINLWGKH